MSLRYTPISQKLLQEGHLLLLKWQGGITGHRIIGRRLLRVAPFIQGFGVVAAGGTQDFTEFKDSNNNRLVDVTLKHPNTMYHVALGIRPTVFRGFLKYPDGIDLRTVSAFDPIQLGLGFNAQRDYFTGVESPYSAPTEYTEMFHPYGVNFTLGLVNTDTVRARQPSFAIEGAKYLFKVLDPSKPGNLELMQKAYSGKIPRRLFTIGPPEKPATYVAKAVWGVDPVELSDPADSGF